MNNRFKFRLWDIKRKQWTGAPWRNNKPHTCNAIISAIGMDGQLHYDDYGNGMYELDNDNYIIQQFTGVLDKNNKEIYEGDIVKTTGPQLDVHAVEYTKGEITWVRESFCLCQSGIGGNEMSYYVHCDCCPCGLEIIGNIFENLELLQ